MVALVLAAGAGAWLAIGHPGGATPAPAWPAGPVPRVNAAAFAGHGELALISRGTLWVLDGATRALRRVATPGMTLAGPVFSADGRWLAFLGIRPGATFGALWVTDGDGSGAHEIRGLAEAGFVGWSPAACMNCLCSTPATAAMSGSCLAHRSTRPGGATCATASTLTCSWPGNASTAGPK
jgi:hypothetical protein